MKRFEYLALPIETVGSNERKINTSDLTEWGKEGWEIILFIEGSPSFFLAKREISEPQFALSISEAWELSQFLQQRMKGKESVNKPIGLIATRLYHWCRENYEL